MFLLSFKRAVFGQLKSAALEFYRSLSSLSFQHLTGNERQWDRFIESFERIGASPKILNIEAFTHICGDSGLFIKCIFCVGNWLLVMTSYEHSASTPLC